MTLLFRSAPGVLVLCCLTSTAIDAGERIDINGSYSGVDKSQSLEIGANHTLISVVDEGLGYLLDAPNDNTPMQYAAGPCGGFMEIKDNHASGHGYCLRSNPSGGKWIVRWVLDSDMSRGLKGTFEITGVEENERTRTPICGLRPE